MSNTTRERIIDQAPGSAIGFSTLEQEVVVDELPLSGELPSWLTGSLLRTGPAKFEVGEQRMRHWFDGLAMLHRFTIEHGCVSYGNRFLESLSYKTARARSLATLMSSCATRTRHPPANVDCSSAAPTAAEP